MADFGLLQQGLKDERTTCSLKPLVHRTERGLTAANFPERPTPRQSCFLFPLLPAGRNFSSFFTRGWALCYPTSTKRTGKMAEQRSLSNSRPEDILTFVDRCKDPSLSSSERDALRSNVVVQRYRSLSYPSGNPEIRMGVCTTIGDPTQGCLS